MDRENLAWARIATSDNAQREKVAWQENGKKLSAENFDGENVDELIKIRQIRQYFPHQNFAPYGILVLCHDSYFHLCRLGFLLHKGANFQWLSVNTSSLTY